MTLRSELVGELVGAVEYQRNPDKLLRSDLGTGLRLLDRGESGRAQEGRCSE